MRFLLNSDDANQRFFISSKLIEGRKKTIRYRCRYCAPREITPERCINICFVYDHPFSLAWTAHDPLLERQKES